MNITIPKNSIFRPALWTFTGTFNVPTLGIYDFNIPANQNVPGLAIGFQSLYFISNVNFGATVPENAFLENILIQPSIRFQLGKSRTSLDGGFYPVANYLKSNPIGTFFSTKENDDRLEANFQGSLSQNASLAAFAAIKAIFSFSVWEIHDQDFLREFKKIPAAAFAKADISIPAEIQAEI